MIAFFFFFCSDIFINSCADEEKTFLHGSDFFSQQQVVLCESSGCEDQKSIVLLQLYLLTYVPDQGCQECLFLADPKA